MGDKQFCTINPLWIICGSKERVLKSMSKHNMYDFFRREFYILPSPP
jgi:hypothetical protein